MKNPANRLSLNSSNSRLRPYLGSCSLRSGGRALAAVLLAMAGCEQRKPLNLLECEAPWSANTDRPGPEMKLSTKDRVLRADISSNGGKEDYPKLRMRFNKPQDWSKYLRLRARLRLTSADRNVREKRIAFVFYDEKTRLPNYPGRPMKQQVISHVVRPGEWTDFCDWLTEIRRTSILQLDIYIYENPPGDPHPYRWEFEQLQLEPVNGNAVAFDGAVFGEKEIKGTTGRSGKAVMTNDGLRLVLGTRGEVVRVSAGDQLLGAAWRGCPSGLLVRDVAREGPPVPVGGKITQSGDGIQQQARLQKLRLAVEATYRCRGPYLEVQGSVTDLSQRDRAVTVYFALPTAAARWVWWDDAVRFRTKPERPAELAALETGMQFGFRGAHSKYPLAALTWPGHGGLSLAIRMDEPVVHRLAYNPGLRLFYVAVDFGLIPESAADGRALSKAPFRFLIFQHNPDWGFRSALQRYYEFFPDFFTRRVKTGGGWYVWGNMKRTDGALDAGFRFHWGPAGAEAVKWDNLHGALSLFYIEPETYQQSMEDFTRRPTFEEVVKRLGKLAEGNREELQQVASLPYRVYPLGQTGEAAPALIHETAQVVTRSLNYDAGGKPYCGIGQYGWMRKSKWGAIFSCNLGPGVPGGKGQFNLRRVVFPALRKMEQQGAHYDGIGLDSFGGYGQTSRANYRREFFRTSRFPLSFSATNYRPVQVSAFATVAWLRELAEDMHGKGKVLMANCSGGSTPGWLTFAAPYLDIFGAESPRFADPDYIRAIARNKPCTDLPYKPRPEWEVARHALHAIFPGQGNELELLKRGAAVLRELSAAKWQPITHARVQPSSVRIERYGVGSPTFLVLHNPENKPVTVSLTTDNSALGLLSFEPTLLPEGKLLAPRGPHLNLVLNSRETRVIALSSSAE